MFISIKYFNSNFTIEKLNVLLVSNGKLIKSHNTQNLLVKLKKIIIYAMAAKHVIFKHTNKK